MKNICKLVILSISLVVVGGCSSKAGPFVTNISSDGNGKLSVEKCMVTYSPWMSTVSNDNCNSTSMRFK